MARLLEPDLSTRLLRVTTAFNEVLYSCANEPSLGLYRIQEHVAVTVPRLVERQRQLRESSQKVEGAIYDLEYDAKTLADMGRITQFASIKNQSAFTHSRYLLSLCVCGFLCRLIRAMELKKKLDELEQRKRTSHLAPATSLPPTHSPLHPPPSSHLSLPPTLTEATPTINRPINEGASSDTEDQPLDMIGSGQDPVPDMGIRPKTFD